MRAWAVVVFGVGVFGFATSGCKNKELEEKLAASEAKAAACSATSAGLEAKVAEQERALAAAKPETWTLRGTLPTIKSASPSPSPKPKVGDNAKDLGF